MNLNQFDMASFTDLDASAQQALGTFFNHHHDKLLCTASRAGVPSIALMGTPRLAENGDLTFEISDPQSRTFQNVCENPAVVFMAYVSGARARDYAGVRLYAEATEVLTAGPRLEQIRQRIRERHGEEKAAELLASITCRITQVRPVIDRGQGWDELPALA